jgi:hypothetical protein
MKLEIGSLISTSHSDKSIKELLRDVKFTKVGAHEFDKFLQLIGELRKFCRTIQIMDDEFDSLFAGTTKLSHKVNTRLYAVLAKCFDGELGSVAFTKAVDFTIEKRYDEDGEQYTYNEFRSYYGGIDQWEKAEGAVPPPYDVFQVLKRVADHFSTGRLISAFNLAREQIVKINKSSDVQTAVKHVRDLIRDFNHINLKEGEWETLLSSLASATFEGLLPVVVNYLTSANAPSTSGLLYTVGSRASRKRKPTSLEIAKGAGTQPPKKPRLTRDSKGVSTLCSHCLKANHAADDCKSKHLPEAKLHEKYKVLRKKSCQWKHSNRRI